MRTVGTVTESPMVRRVVVEAMVMEAVAMAMVMAEVVEEIKDIRIVRMNRNLKKHHHQQNHRRKRRTTQMGSQKYQFLKV